MPIPIPSKLETAGAHSGLATTLTASPISPVEITKPNSAVARGRPAATIEPNAISRMNAAATKLATSELAPPCASRIGPPPSSIRRPSPLACSAIEISRSPVSVGTSHARSVSCRLRIAIVPSGDTRRRSARPTPSKREARTTKSSTRRLISGRTAPDGASHTTSTVSLDEAPPNRCAIRRAASSDSDPGVEYSASYSPASALPPAASTARPITHATTTRPRRRTARSANRARRPLAGGLALVLDSGERMTAPWIGSEVRAH